MGRLGSVVRHSATAATAMARPWSILKRWLVAGGFIVALGTLVMFVGVRHDIWKVEKEIGRPLAETDWIGVRWLKIGVLSWLTGAVCAVTGVVLHLLRKHQQRIRELHQREW